ncbi:PREDICTED: serine protease gd-like [Rhagoletis zephyria]|uniref:serine protease gd-like n=1 Tax=Rhagoletis zephyria TaxID=28612 RepID=UPI00081136CB|nr:PREDICTED: serine protease gd-like [Rhagoletis zephyria]
MWPLLLLSILLLPDLSTPQLPDTSPCEQRFFYVREGNDYFGTIKLDRLERGRTAIKVTFSQRDSLTSNYYGTITPYPDEQLQVTRMPALFRVHFPNPKKPPKLTQLSINGQVLCSGPAYPAPSSWFELTYAVNAYTGATPAPASAPALPAPTTTVVPTPRPSAASALSSAPTLPAVVASPPKFSNIFLTERVQQNTSFTCGTEGTVVRPFLHGGNELVRGQFPWMTAVYRKESVHTLSYICGGTMLSARSVVSAAHCFQNLAATQIALFLGRTNLESFSEDGFLTRDVERLIKHPDYNNLPDADIAVLRMQTVGSFTDYIRPICLWTESTQITRIVGLSGTVAGWGSNENGELVSPVAKKVDVEIVTEVDCLRSSAVFSKLVTSRTFCAGNRNGVGPCMGDSGSGLVLQRNNRWMLRGIVSFGQTKRGQCNLYEYVVYVDVAQHLNWLQDNME